MNILKLVLNLMYLYANPEAPSVGVDPVSSFMIGLGAIWAVAYLMRGLMRRSVWAAVGMMIALPLLYLLMVDGLAVALVHNAGYFAAHPVDGWWLEVVPSSVLVVVYGVQALSNYRQRFRRLR